VDVVRERHCKLLSASMLCPPDQENRLVMCVTSLVTASKERQTGAKSCKAGKLHNAHKRARYLIGATKQ
jgi:hypothetical protein